MSNVQSYALVLTGPVGAAALDAAAVEAARLLLTGREIIRERWLAPGDAWEALLIAEEAEDVAPLRSRISAALAPGPIDVNIVPDEPAHRRKKLLVADMEFDHHRAGMPGRAGRVRRPATRDRRHH